MTPLAEALNKEWRANGRRWEAVAARVRALGIEVWNPGIYGAAPYSEFLEKYPPKRGALLALGLNPSPYGMAQTGIPFTDCRTAKKDLGIEMELPGCAPGDLRERLKHPQRAGKWRSTYERSSLVVYGFLRHAWGDLKTAYANWFVGNPCPLLFLDPVGWNVTPADRRLKKVSGMQELRATAVERFQSILNARGIVCLGNDVAEAVGDLARKLVGPDNLITYPHPARAVPKLWAEGLKKELQKRELL